MNKKLISRILALVIFAVALTGCNAAQQATEPAEPTIDQGQLRTEVAQTVVANVTYEAALTKAAEPTATVEVVAPTQEEAAEVPLTPTLPIETFTPTAVIPSLTPTATTQIVYPTWTPTYYPDRAELSAISPAQGKTYSPGADFDLVLTLKNTGDSTWNSNFYVKFVSGVSGETHADSAVTLVYVPGSVAPGKTVDLVIDMIAPQASGYYQSNWTFINNDGTSILAITYVFYVN